MTTEYHRINGPFKTPMTETRFYDFKLKGQIHNSEVNRVTAERIWERAWEWEDGDGFTIVGTHDPYVAHKAIFDLLLYTVGGPKGKYEDLPYYLPEFEYVRGHGDRLWVSKEDLASDDERPWKTYTRWWFGRKRVFLVSV